jgi:hypothetical protein
MLPTVCERWGTGSDRCVLAFEHLGPCKDAQGNTTLSTAVGFKAYLAELRHQASMPAERAGHAETEQLAAGRCYECGGRHKHTECPGAALEEPVRTTARYEWDGLKRMTPDRLRRMQRERGDMKIGSAFPGQYLKAADLNGKRVPVVIDSVAMEDIGGETKPILHFRGKERGLVLNKTNANSISMIIGTDETDDWPGKAITLFPSKTEFQGKRVDCIRVDPPARGAAMPPPPPEPVRDFEASDEDVPF